MLKRLIIASLILIWGILAGCGGTQLSTPVISLDRPNPPPQYQSLVNSKNGDSAAQQSGKALYSIHCVMCHGQTGKGDGPAAMTLTPKPQSLAANQAGLSDAYLFWRISEGGLEKPFLSAMPSWKSILNEQEIWEVVSYLRTLRD